VLTNAVVEPWNAASSLFISLFGLMGLLYSNPTREFRVTTLYLLLIVIGLGSTALHTSLHWFAQSLDELPMLWFNVYALFFLSTLHTPLKGYNNIIERSRVDDSGITAADNKYISSCADRCNSVSTHVSNGFSTRETRMAVMLSLLGGGVTYVYYVLQSFYGVFVGGYIFTVVTVSLWTFALVFGCPSRVGTTSTTSSNNSSCSGHRAASAVVHTFGGGCCCREGVMMMSADPPLPSAFPLHTLQLSQSQRLQQQRITRQAKTCLKRAVVVFGGMGFCCWLVDMCLCPCLLPYYTSCTRGLTLHVLWHLGAAYGGYLHIQTLILLRIRALGRDVHLHWPSDHDCSPPSFISAEEQEEDQQHTHRPTRRSEEREAMNTKGVVGAWLLYWLCLPVLCDQTSLQKSSEV
jgi:hypothetical protein